MLRFVKLNAVHRSCCHEEMLAALIICNFIADLLLSKESDWSAPDRDNNAEAIVDPDQELISQELIQQAFHIYEQALI